MALEANAQADLQVSVGEDLVRLKAVVEGLKQRNSLQGALAAAESILSRDLARVLKSSSNVSESAGEERRFRVAPS